MQGTVTSIKAKERNLLYVDNAGKEQTLAYDMLDLAVGSVIQQAEPDQGGISLTGVEAAQQIRETWLRNMQQAVSD